MGYPLFSYNKENWKWALFLLFFGFSGIVFALGIYKEHWNLIHFWVKNKRRERERINFINALLFILQQRAMKLCIIQNLFRHFFPVLQWTLVVKFWERQAKQTIGPMQMLDRLWQNKIIISYKGTFQKTKKKKKSFSWHYLTLGEIRWWRRQLLIGEFSIQDNPCHP